MLKRQQQQQMPRYILAGNEDVEEIFFSPSYYTTCYAQGRALGPGCWALVRLTLISLPYFGVKLSCVCLMFASRKK